MSFRDAGAGKIRYMFRLSGPYDRGRKNGRMFELKRTDILLQTNGRIDGHILMFLGKRTFVSATVLVQNVLGILFP